MSTQIPHTVLSEILASKLSPETTVALLNEAEAKYSPSPKHWNAKRTYPFWKACQNCGKPFTTLTKEQAIRNKTCGKACMAAMIGAANTGVTPVELRTGMTECKCAVCGVAFWRPKAWVKRTQMQVCGYQCNGALRGEDLKAHAHKGRANWTPESEAALKDRMTGPSNPFWKGGLTYRNRKGAYADQPIKYVRCPPEFLGMARTDGYVMEHRLIVASALGRTLTRSESVHHVNHDATDNQPENLMLFATNGQHKAFEHGAAIKPLWCGLCLSTTSARSGACACRQAHSSPFAAE